MADFDFVIVGAGAAGCVLASRLSENPRNRLLLLDYGGRDTNPIIYVPEGFYVTLRGDRYTYHYSTRPIGPRGQVEVWTRGKGLGGSTAVNGMMRIRGTQADWDGVARPVEPAFVRLPPDVESGTVIEDPINAQVADFATGMYEVTLQVLSRYYIHHGETAAEFDTLARTAKHLMNWVMRELGPVLTALPVGPSHPGRTAGPTFVIARPAIVLLPHQDAAWKIITERLDALKQACASLGQQAGLGALAPLAEKLQSMSQDISTHSANTGG